MNEPAKTILELSVSEFAQRFEKYIHRKAELRSIAIRGEISGWSPQANGGLYFRLKDADALIDCYAFASNARRFEQIEDGLAVVATGSIEIRQAKSSYQLLVSEIRATGTGALYAQYQALRERFEREGLFAPERKRKVPRFIRSVALVSANRLGAEDFITKLRQQAPFVSVTFVETRVQGTGAEIDIADALDRASRLPVDAIVLTRGGGSFEDLFPFNTESVIRAIIRASRPVITAVAHTRNRHLADFVSDFAAETPTAAAAQIASAWQRGIESVNAARTTLGFLVDRVLSRAAQHSDDVQGRLRSAWERQVAAKRERLQALTRRIDSQSPTRKLAERAARLASTVGRLDASAAAMVLRSLHRSDESSKRLNRAVAASFDRKRRMLERSASGLNAVDPLAPLRRGYAIVTQNGIAIREAAQLSQAQVASVRFGRGTAEIRVESTVEDG